MRIILLIVTIFFFQNSYAKHPKCDGPENWPAAMAHATLKNKNIIENDKFDFTKTKVKRIASEKIAKDLYKQVHFIQFFDKKGKELTVMTVSDSSNEECSMDKVKIFLISNEY